MDSLGTCIVDPDNGLTAEVATRFRLESASRRGEIRGAQFSSLGTFAHARGRLVTCGQAEQYIRNASQLAVSVIHQRQRRPFVHDHEWQARVITSFQYAPGKLVRGLWRGFGHSDGLDAVCSVGTFQCQINSDQGREQSKCPTLHAVVQFQPMVSAAAPPVCHLVAIHLMYCADGLTLEKAGLKRAITNVRSLRSGHVLRLLATFSYVRGRPKLMLLEQRTNDATS